MNEYRFPVVVRLFSTSWDHILGQSHLKTATNLGFGAFEFLWDIAYLD